MNGGRPQTGLLSRPETRSIDYVPTGERGGRFLDQATVWFAGSAQLLTLATGAIGISLGLNLAWTLIGLALGTILGTIPVSAHATQGPHLGLPQMIQSRPQFGRYGALMIWAMAIIVYWGYVVLGGNMIGATNAELGWGSAPVWAIIVCLIAVVLAVYGYHWLHVAQRAISIFLGVAIVVYIVGLAAGGHIPAGLFDLTESFDIGAVCASLIPEAGVIGGLAETGSWVFPGLGVIVIVAGALGLIGLMGMCVYGGSLTLITAIDSIRTILPTRKIRIITILIIGLTATFAAALVPQDFLDTQLATVLFVVGYFMAPWTAVNLTDFFAVRKGQYSITEMFNPKGVYGLWNWRGIVSYLATLVIMVPFMDLGFYTGPVAQALGGVDIAFFVGIPIACIMYWLFCLGQDIDGERERIKGSDLHLDEVAAPIE